MVNEEGVPRKKGEWRKVRKWPEHRKVGTLICETCKRTYAAKAYQIRRGQRFCSGACRNHRTEEQRFWSRVQKTEGCWNWTGALVAGRYGNSTWKNKPSLAHRASWEMHHGDIPEGLNVCHHCDNGKCVRPDHLFLGTQKDNVQDMIKKGRHHTRILSKDQVREIRTSTKPRQELSDTFKVSIRAIADIQTGRVWKKLI